jgi:hypothetical protein
VASLDHPVQTVLMPCLHILKFEHRSSQHLMTLLGIKREFKPEVSEATQDRGLDAEAEDHYCLQLVESGLGERRVPDASLPADFLKQRPRFYVGGSLDLPFHSLASTLSWSRSLNLHF